MLSKSQSKRITSLGQKKYRIKEQAFVAEGVKVIQELLDSTFKLDGLWVEEEAAFAKALSAQNITFETVTAQELKKVTFLSTSQTALAIFKIPAAESKKREGLTLVLDDVRDPGNLGTIIRLCDWFGITELVCSKQTVDCYNPKVVQATMGSLTRVQISYEDLNAYLASEKRPVYGTFMDGEDIYKSVLPKEAILVMGNEANGISAEIESLVTNRLGIPRFGPQQATESLNVATATAICLSEFRRSSLVY
ncbi:RNA methyltransferase [Dokdonia sinensis]|uniref:RNA methyltransferase n=1 Tax=Dokdonia sinensis TaxID=2479847 RepID=A0A3M0GG91_9FLAO|nr:RNA methyltransferase [Dokdonia sinensis]RMB56336.1 RNA methyltransferase [Dokdonia sinensis]